MLISIHPRNPQLRLIKQVAEILRSDGVIAYPTDTIYGVGCSIFSKKGIDRIYELKERDRKKPMSFICADLSDIARYAVVGNYAYRTMKRLLPGPYTFVLRATKEVPRMMQNRQQQVGIRVPDSAICLALVRELGHPIVTTSANLSGEDPLMDPEVIESQWGHLLDAVIDGGILKGEPSSVVELGDERAVVLRKGKGDVEIFEERV